MKNYKQQMIIGVIITISCITILSSGITRNNKKEFQAQSSTTRAKTEIQTTMTPIPTTTTTTATIPTTITRTTTTKKITTTKFSAVEVSNHVSEKGYGRFKSYTDYRCISQNSEQWKYQAIASTDANGMRVIDGYFLAALGSYYGTELGTKYRVTLSTGNVFYMILCDCKADKDTDSLHQKSEDGSVVEFYVDTEKLPRYVRRSGNIGSIKALSGDIIKIEKVGKYKF